MDLLFLPLSVVFFVEDFYLIKFHLPPRSRYECQVNNSEPGISYLPTPVLLLYHYEKGIG